MNRRRSTLSPERLESRSMLSAAPIAAIDSYSAPADVAIDRPAPGWLTNDMDADAEALQIATVTNPAHGTLTWQPNGSWKFQSNPGFVGVDQFSYQATDGTNLSNSANVLLRVGSYAERVLADDPLGFWRLGESTGTLSAQDVSGHGFHGEYAGVTLGKAGGILAEPDTAAEFGVGNTHVYLGGPAELLGLVNQLTIEAWVAPSTLTSLGRIFVNAPHAIDRGIGFGLYQNRLIFTSFGIQDYISRPVLDTVGQWYHVAVVVDSTNNAEFYVNGHLVDRVAGSETPRAGSHAGMIGTKSGSSELLHGVLDEVAVYDHMLSAEQLAEHYEMGHVSSGRAPQIVDDSYSIQTGRTLSTHADSPVDVGVLANDLDVDTPAGIVAQLVGPPQQGDVQFRPDGGFDYTPAPGFVGIDTFTYRADDGANLSELATVQIEVFSPVPDAEDDQYQIAEDTPLIVGDAQLGLLGNDRDRNQLPMHASLVSGPEHGALELQPNGTFSYQPDADYNGVDTFAYAASNGTYTSPAASVTIQIESVNDVAISQDDLYVLDPSRTLTVLATDGVLANDHDVDSLSLSVELLQPPAFGTLMLGTNGSFAYTAAATFLLTDEFTYRVSDAAGWSQPAKVVLQRDTPTIQVESKQLLANTPNQKLELRVTGAHAVSGLDLYVQVGDGGPELVDLGLPAGQSGPRISTVELKSGTIFQDLQDQPIDLGSLPQFANWSIAAAGGGDVVAEGLLATLTIDTTGFFGGQWDVRVSGLLPVHPLGPFASNFAGKPALFVDGKITIVPAEVKGRHLFYNGSNWDGNDARANQADDAAIAVDKQPLLPGQTATFANYSSFSQGINGVIVDIVGLPATTSLTVDDFRFRVGSTNIFSTWLTAPTPQLAVRLGEGAEGSDRLTFVWPDRAIRQQWLEITILAGARTLLAADDRFYFGNAIGETGNAAGDSLVTSIDVIAARDHQRGPFALASIDDVYDFNRDRIVSSVDVILARDHQVGPLKALPLITPLQSPSAVTAPAANTGIALTSGDANRDGVFDSRDLVEVLQAGEFEDAVPFNSDWSDGDWNGDGDFDSSDLVLALQAGRYEQATDVVAATVFDWDYISNERRWQRSTGTGYIDGKGGATSEPARILIERVRISLDGR